jgi:hypothetical protein
MQACFAKALLIALARVMCPLPVACTPINIFKAFTFCSSTKNR